MAYFTKYTKNKDYFLNKDNLEVCYWAGFIAADGCVHRKYYGVSFDLSERDAKHLELFAKAVGSNASVKYRVGSCGTPMASFYINSIEFTKNLCENFNITPVKTHTLKPPLHLAYSSKLAYLAGLIDGDGCINIRRANVKGVKYDLSLTITSVP